jgi:hypothetical protein
MNTLVQFIYSIRVHCFMVYIEIRNFWVRECEHYSIMIRDTDSGARLLDTNPYPDTLLSFPGSHEHQLFWAIYECSCATSTPGIIQPAWLWSSWHWWVLQEPIPSCHCLLLHPEPSRLWLPMQPSLCISLPFLVHGEVIFEPGDVF